MEESVPQEGDDLPEYCIFGSFWPNGQRIQVFYYPDLRADLDPSDHINLMITDGEKTVHDWIMNVEDAIDIITGLSKAIACAVSDGVPVKPKGTTND